MKSAIGEELTRKDHGDVSNQLVSVQVSYGHFDPIDHWNSTPNTPSVGMLPL